MEHKFKELMKDIKEALNIASILFNSSDDDSETQLMLMLNIGHDGSVLSKQEYIDSIFNNVKILVNELVSLLEVSLNNRKNILVYDNTNIDIVLSLLKNTNNINSKLFLNLLLTNKEKRKRFMCSKFVSIFNYTLEKDGNYKSIVDEFNTYDYIEKFDNACGINVDIRSSMKTFLETNTSVTEKHEAISNLNLVLEEVDDTKFNPHKYMEPIVKYNMEYYETFITVITKISTDSNMRDVLKLIQENNLETLSLLAEFNKYKTYISSYIVDQCNNLSNITKEDGRNLPLEDNSLIKFSKTYIKLNRYVNNIDYMFKDLTCKNIASEVYLNIVNNIVMEMK